MENKSFQQSDEKNKNSKALLYTIIGVLLALNGGLFYMWKKGSNDKEQVDKKLETTTSELKIKNQALEDAEFLLEKYRRDSITMVENSKELNEDLVAKKNEIAALVARLRSVKDVSEKEINLLREKIRELTEQLAKAERENVELREVNTKLEEERSRLKEEKETVETQNRELSVEKQKYKSIAQKLQTSSMKIEALKKRWLTGKEATSNRAKDVEAFRTSFSLSENKVAEPGTKTIYVKITGPEGITLANPGNEGGTFEYDQKESKYTYKFTTEYDQESVAVPPTKWRPATDLKAGKYTIELYCDGFKIGAQSVSLK
jgi:DNA repair exonuclease SbcCD ATPase subunit